MKQWQANVHARAVAGECQTSTCSDAPAPSGYTCRGHTAGEETTSGITSTCSRGATEYRSYSTAR